MTGDDPAPSRPRPSFLSRFSNVTPCLTPPPPLNTLPPWRVRAPGSFMLRTVVSVVPAVFGMWTKTSSGRPLAPAGRRRRQPPVLRVRHLESCSLAAVFTRSQLLLVGARARGGLPTPGAAACGLHRHACALRPRPRAPASFARRPTIPPRPRPAWLRRGVGAALAPALPAALSRLGAAGYRDRSRRLAAAAPLGAGLRSGRSAVRCLGLGRRRRPCRRPVDRRAAS